MQVGALLFFIGCYFAVVETANVDFEDKWHQWLASGQTTERPVLRFSPLADDDEDGKKEFLSYYGCLIQFFGSIVFLIGATSSVLGGHGFLPEDGPFSEYVMVDVMFLIGGFCFALGAFFLVAEGTIVPMIRILVANPLNCMTSTLITAAIIPHSAGCRPHVGSDRWHTLH